MSHSCDHRNMPSPFDLKFTALAVPYPTKDAGHAVPSDLDVVTGLDHSHRRGL